MRAVAAALAEEGRFAVRAIASPFGVSRSNLIERSTYNYNRRRADQTPLRMRLRELAEVRRRYGYRRLTVLLHREGWTVNHKRIYRLYRAEDLEVWTKKRKKRASHLRVVPRNGKPGLAPNPRPGI